MVMKHTFLLIVVIVGTWAQSEPTLKKDVNAYLPPEFQGKINETQVQDLGNKTQQLFKEKCEKNGGPNAFSNVEKAAKELKVCLESLVNVTALEEEVENAKPSGQVDEVFKKYCQKTPDFKGCFRTATEATKPCFTVAERDNLKTVYNVTEQLAEFICFKEGDRIALFIAEGGKECFEEKQPEIQECFNKTLNVNSTLNPEALSIDSIPEINFGEKECKQMNELQLCVVTVLEQCKQPTSANIVESLFRFIRKATPCKKYDVKEASDPSGRKAAESNGTARGATITSMLVALAVSASLLV